MKTSLAACITAIIASATLVMAEPARPSFDVKSYGAVGDGTTDDTAAIQKAIDAAETAGGGVVTFASGTYLLDSNHPSSHPWFFYNLKIGSNVTLRGTTGTKLLQGPGGRHAIVERATQVRNTMLAFGPDYTVIRFQNKAYNGGFYALQATAANESSVSLSRPADASHFKPGDYVAIYKFTSGDVIPTETARVVTADDGTGTVRLDSPLARSFPKNPSIANVTSLVTTNGGVENMIVQGVEPLAVTEAFGFKAAHCQFISDTSVGGGNVLGVSLNTLHDFQFIDDAFLSAGPAYVPYELAQRNSQDGVFDGNTFSCANAGFGEYAAHIRLTRNHFQLHAGPSVVAGIFIGGMDVEFSNNDVQGGNVTGGSGWGVILADFIGPAEYAPYVGRIRISDNRFDCRADGNACLGIFAPDTSVTGNVIKANGSARGIHAEGPLPQANHIKGNKLLMDTGDGMLIVTPATGGSGSVITGNTITGSGAFGIYVNAHGSANAGGNSVSDNTITGFKTALSIH